MQNDKVKFKIEFKRRLYTFILKLIEAIENLPKDRVCYILGDQLLRSSTSILGNYIEGQAASSKKDFIKYFEISLKTANESKVWSAILRDRNKISKEKSEWFIRELNEISNIFGSSVLTLKGKR
ncbi:MAG: four helix bundle protein [Patescibacteria group bacterium]|jgi:four helix bundle protein